jgi:hypothetical protein
MSDTSRALHVLRELQREFGVGTYFAGLAGELAAALEADRTLAATRYCSVDWWGGSGSMADFIPEDIDARRRIMKLMIEVVRSFDELGIHCPRAAQWTGTFSYWLERGIV